MNGVTVVVWAGIAALVVVFGVVGGIIASVINDGDHHKARMTTAPPPPSAPPARMMRAMTENEEVYGMGRNHFELTRDEHKLFATLARRSR